MLKFEIFACFTELAMVPNCFNWEYNWNDNFIEIEIIDITLKL